MKVIVAGSRTITDEATVRRAMRTAWRMGIRPTEVVSGACWAGVDALGEKIAREASIPVKRFPADWSAHGRAAGPLRNAAMAEYADALVAVWDGRSRGTANMIEEARKRGLAVHVEQVR